MDIMTVEQVEVQAVEFTEAVSDQQILAGIDVEAALADAESVLAQFGEPAEVADKPKRASKAKADKPAAKPKAVTSSKTFTVAGLSVHKGELKLRFANDLKGREKVLDKNGHEEIRLVEFAEGTKQELVAQLLAHVDFQDSAAQEVLKAATGE